MTIIDGFVFANKERQLPEPKWWIEELMTERSITMISAQPKAGKSAWAAHLTYAVATGSPFFGRDVPQGTVLYLAGERAGQTEDRLRALFDDATPMNFALFVPTMSSLGLIKFNREGDTKRLIEKVKAMNFNPTLIVIDTLSQFYEGSQNDDALMHKFMDGVRELCNAFDSCGLVIHHDTKLYVDASGKKSGGGSYRGSGDALASVDAHIRGRVIKKVPDPDDPRGEREVNIVEFELEEDNFGGSFKQTVAVRRTFEDAAPYLDAAKKAVDKLKTLALTVIKATPRLTTTAWYDALKAHPDFKGTLGVGKFNDLRDELVEEGLVTTEPNPDRKNGVVYLAA